MEEHSGAPWEFMSHPRWQRFLIAIAGPFMNGLLCVAVLTGVYMVHFEDPVYLQQPTVIGWVEPGSIAAKAGLQAGDRIAQINGTNDPTWEATGEKLALSAGSPAHLKVVRGNATFTTNVTLNGTDHLGVLPDQPYIITRIESGLPAAKAGMRLGDEVLSVDDVPVRSTPALSDYLQTTKDKPVDVKIRRNGTVLDFKIIPQLSDLGNQKRYRVGIISDPVRIEKLPFAVAFTQSLTDTRKNSLLIVDLLRQLTHSTKAIKQMSSIIGISQVSGEAARAGLFPYLSILAVISLNLGILNLLPIPILDGGLILMLAIEGILRREIKREVKELVYQAAFVLLVLFTVVVMFNDISRLRQG